MDEALTDLNTVSTKTRAAVGDLKENIDVLKTAQDEVIQSVALLADSRKTGIERVHAYSTHVATQEGWMRRLISAQECIDLMGYTLLVWTKGVNFEHELAQRVRSGVRVRVLIMHEENEQLTAVLNSKIPGAILQQSKVEISGMRDSMKDIATRLRDGSQLAGSFEFRTLKEGTILMQLCRTDARLTAVQYLYSVIASQSPLLEVNGKNSELFTVYTKEFETLWKAGTPEEVTPKPPSSL